MNDKAKAVLEEMKRRAPGFYTESDEGPWYVVTPDGLERVAEDFDSRDNARRFVVWIAGGEKPKGWRIANVTALSAEVIIPGRYVATLWIAAARRHFPNLDPIIKE